MEIQLSNMSVDKAINISNIATRNNPRFELLICDVKRNSVQKRNNLLSAVGEDRIYDTEL